MQPADHVDFGYPKGHRLPDSTDNFIDRVFEGVRITLSSRKSAELAGKDADVGVIDVTIVNVGRVVAIFSLAQNVGDHSERVEVVRAVERDRIGLGDSLGRLNFFGDRPEFFWNEQIIHAAATTTCWRSRMHSALPACNKNRGINRT